MKERVKQSLRYALGAKLVTAREQRGLKQSDAARKVEIKQSDLSKIENGQKKLEFLLLIQLAKLYKKPFAFFVPNLLAKTKKHS